MKTGRKKLLSRVLVLALVMALTLGTALAPVSAMAQATLTDGTYTGAANGMGGAGERNRDRGRRKDHQR